MKLPITFRSDVEVIVEEANRFRALSPEDRMREIRGLLSAGGLMIRLSPKSAFLRRYALEQEELARRTVKEFVARHVH